MTPWPLSISPAFDAGVVVVVVVPPGDGPSGNAGCGSVVVVDEEGATGEVRILGRAGTEVEVELFEPCCELAALEVPQAVKTTAITVTAAPSRVRAIIRLLRPVVIRGVTQSLPMVTLKRRELDATP